MTTSFNGTTGITFPDASTQSNSQVGMKNRIIDGGFTINQRGYVSGTSLPSGTYGHDRWKGGASAGTYTFTQGALGVNTTITITAGSIIQVIEGCNLPEGGTYVLSWTGTAQGRLNGGTYGSSGTVTVTGWVAGTNLNVEFNTGTCGSVQLEKGSTATSFDYRPYGTELALCQRYYEQMVAAGSSTLSIGQCYSTTAILFSILFRVTKRTAPTFSNGGNLIALTAAGANAGGTPSLNSASVDSARVDLTGCTSIVAGNASALFALSGSFIAFSSEL
jgi:hypothetical protein